MTVNDSTTVTTTYMAGRLEEIKSDCGGDMLATCTCNSMGAPVSVQVGSAPNNSPRYYDYNGHGDVVALVDAQGNVAASYAYDAFGALTAASENFGGTTTWTNPYRYDGRDGVRYDGETGLYWMRVRAYDPALGRFLSRDPLHRVPLIFSDQPYIYVGNNPLRYTDPSGQRRVCDGDCLPTWTPAPPPPPKPTGGCHSDGSCGCYTSCGGGNNGSGGTGPSNNGKCGGTVTCSPTVTSPSPSSCAPGDTVCQACNGDGQCRAQQNALDAAWYFGKMAGALALLAVLLAPILGEPLAQLGAAATYLAATFGREAGYPSAWFTVENISEFGSQQIAGPLIAWAALGMLGGLVLAAFGAMAEVPFISLPAYAVGAEMFVAGLLTVGILASAMDNIYRQEALVYDGQAQTLPMRSPR